MNKKKEHRKLVPELRFSEFEEEWYNIQLQEVLDDIKLGGNYKNGKHEKGVPLIKMGNIGRGSIKLDTLQYISKDLEYDKDDVLQNGDILFNTRNTLELVGKVAIWKDELNLALYNSNLLRLNFSEKYIGSHFFMNYLFNTEIGIKKLRSIATGTTSVAAIYTKDLLKVELSIPPHPEQQKIAHTLTTLDELIAAEQEKRDALAAHKKGLLQQLFPAKGEKVPKVRFGEFEGEWEYKPWDKVYSFKITNSFSRNKLNNDEGAVKNIHYGDIHTKFQTLFDITKEDVPFINQDVSIERISKENFCLEGDIIIADASEDLDDIGKSIEIVNLNNEKLLAGLHTLLARQIEQKLIIGFGGYLFKSDSIRNQIKREAQGAKVLGISKGRMSNLKIYYPSQKTEQQKIANCLVSLDELIAAQSEKIDALKEHKKGLMQGLFLVV